ncbi:snake venom 5'-nucleotidase-like [Amphiura filiformis]|uniref:snake venom 5'-nucleotidase-like n=1 Tax=Amphiura filiformis TaxID=82378 RepID=UPI003B21BE05
MVDDRYHKDIIVSSIGLSDVHFEDLESSARLGLRHRQKTKTKKQKATGKVDMTFGNQEFTYGSDVLASLLQDIDFDAVSANLNTTLEPTLQGLINKSIIKQFEGESVGIIGYGTQVINDIAAIGNLYFEDTIEAIQTEVDALAAMGVNKIIVLGHDWGSYELSEAVEIATSISGVDIMVLGGLRLFQCSCCPPPEEDVPASHEVEKYPIVVTPDDKPKVLLVHGYRMAKSIGRLNVIFNEEGEVREWYGGPIRLDKEVEQDPDLLAEINVWSEPIRAQVAEMNRVIGSSDVMLPESPKGLLTCREKECTLGNLIADAMYWKCTESLRADVLNTSIIAVMNGGGIRQSLEEGEIRFSDVKEVLPFSNTFDTVELEGRYVREILEHAASAVDRISGRFLQVSGIRVTYDLCREPYDGRVVDVQVRRHIDYFNSYYEPLDDDKIYKVIVPSFVGSGGDGYYWVPDQGQNYETGDLGENVVAEFIEVFSPVARYVEGRITFNTEPCPTTPTTTDMPSSSTTPFLSTMLPEFTTSSITSPSGGEGGGGTEDKPRKDN